MSSTVHVQTIDSNFELQVDNSLSLELLKLKIEETTSIPATEQKLSLNGVELTRADQKVGELGTTSEAPLAVSYLPIPEEFVCPITQASEGGN